jgi:alpha-tubulin suppressor-like RCC1 family protein
VVLVLGSTTLVGGVPTASAAPIPAVPAVSAAAAVPGDDGSVGASISAGRWHTCAVRSDGTAQCWGDSTISLGLLNLFFPLNPVSVDVEVGVEVPDDLGTVASVAVGDWQACAIRSDGTVRCWGTFGEAFPPPADLGTVRTIDGGGFHTCAVRTDGLARCWGSDFVGLQTGGPSPMTVPADLGTVRSISTSAISSCAVRADGTVRCWGTTATAA